MAVESLFQQPRPAEVEEAGHVVTQVGSRGILVEQLVEGDVVARGSAADRSTTTLVIRDLVPAGRSLRARDGAVLRPAIRECLHSNDLMVNQDRPPAPWAIA